jgi:hypothetical protein
MAFVIRNKDGAYLRRAASSKARTWEQDISKATTWDLVGAAKNAAHLAGKKGDILFIQEVIVILLHNREPEPIKIKR